jgi:hypothetical protein
MIPDKITLPKIPKFLPSPDQKTGEMFITCSKPLALFWVRQTIPAQIYIIEGPQDEKLLRQAAEWWRKYAVSYLNEN